MRASMMRRRCAVTFCVTAELTRANEDVGWGLKMDVSALP